VRINNTQNAGEHQVSRLMVHNRLNAAAALQIVLQKMAF
jgi:hypothetical protein